MANPQFAFGVDGRSYTLTDLSAEVLGALVAALPAVSGKRRAVITVPAYFHDPQRLATEAAGAQAGLEVIGTINEPTAAALAYGLAHPELTGTILVYDLGGGTFDVTLIDYSADAMRVIGSDGDYHLGGVLWDQRLMELVADRFSDAHDVDVLADPAAVADLRLACEQAKFSLSAREQVKVPVRCGGQSDSVVVTRAEFEAATLDYLDRTRELIVRLIRETGVPWPRIDATVLVGGSTRMPAVRALISGLARKQPLADINPDECVAQGAALWAATQTGQPVFAGMLPGGGAASAAGRGLRVMTDVSPHSLGYVQESADGHRYINGTVITKNTPLPTVQTRPSVVRTDPRRESSFEVIVLQGDAERVLDNEIVGRYEIGEVPDENGSTIVSVSFGYDASGIVRVRAVAASSAAELPVRSLDAHDDYAWTDADPEEGQGRAAADIVFLVDTSGSMSDAIEGVKSSCSLFASEVAKQGVQVRLGLIGFDIGGHRGSASQSYSVCQLSRYTIGVWPLDEPATFKKNISTLSLGLFGGSGCYLANDDTIDIFPHVVGAYDESSATSRILVIISDEMGSSAGLAAIVGQLRAAAVTTHVVGVAGGSGAHQSLAADTGGQFWDMKASRGSQDFSSLLEALGAEIGHRVAREIASRSHLRAGDLG